MRLEDEGETTRKALTLELEQVRRERLAQERLAESVKATVARLSKEIDDTKGTLGGLEGESEAMNAYFDRMEQDAVGVKEQLEGEEAILEQLESDEAGMVAQQDAVMGEHTTKLQEEEAQLGSLRELSDMREV